ncbi:MAG: PIN domain-containing protein [Oscillospiraceae bacterium]
MKVLLDTNVLIDYISMRPGYSDNAQKILRYCMEKKIEGYIADHFLK